VHICVLLQSCIKPQHQEVKLEVGLDMESCNYDKSRGEQIAWNVDGAGSKDEKKKAEEKFFKKLVCCSKHDFRFLTLFRDVSFSHMQCLINFSSD
jgi:Sin-like protein conserved region.